MVIPGVAKALTQDPMACFAERQKKGCQFLTELLIQSMTKDTLNPIFLHEQCHKFYRFTKAKM